MADIELVQGDSGLDIEGIIRNKATDEPMDLGDADEVRFQLRLENADQYAIDALGQIVTPATGEVSYTLQEGDLSQWGDFIAQWEIHWADGSILTTTPANTVEVRRQ